MPGESHGQRSLAGYSPWCHKKSDTIEATEHARGSWAEVVTVRIWFEGQADRTAGGLDVGSRRKGKRGQDDSDVSAWKNQKNGAAIVSRCLSFLVPSI